MFKEGSFGTFEAVSLITLTLVTKNYYTSIRLVIESTGTAAWYTTIVSCLTSMLLFLLLYLLMKRFPGKDLVQIFDEVTGKVIGKFLSLIFVAYFIYYAGSNLREFLEMIKAFNLPYTPPSVILFSFIAVIIAMAYVGLEGIARFASASFFPIILGNLLILAMASTFYNYDAIFPLGGYGIGKSLNIGVLRSSAYSEVVILGFVINSIHGAKNFLKTGLISLIISGFVISSSILCNVLAFDYTQGEENISAMFQLTRIIYLGRFLQRIESIFLFIWIMASFVTVGTAFYISLSIFCKSMTVENHKPLILPFSFLTGMIAILPKSLSEVSEQNIKYIRQYSIFIMYFIPILVLLTALILRKKGDKVKHAKN